MATMPAPLRRLVEQLTRLPGVGEKSAARLAFFLLRADTEYAQALADAVMAVKRDIRLCPRCLGFTEHAPCSLCADPRRSDDVVCVVEDPADVMAIERAGDFRGRYHVLHGTLAPLEGVGPEHLKVAELLARLRALARRRTGRHSPHIELGSVTIDPASREVRVAGAPIELTAREYALTLALAEQPRRVLSRRQLEDAIYSLDDCAISNVVEVYVSRLRRKLGRESIATVRGVGYRWGDPPARDA
jgi:recombinational DNA repair protein RecR